MPWFLFVLVLIHSWLPLLVVLVLIHSSLRVLVACSAEKRLVLQNLFIPAPFSPTSACECCQNHHCLGPSVSYTFLQFALAVNWTQMRSGRPMLWPILLLLDQECSSHLCDTHIMVKIDADPKQLLQTLNPSTQELLSHIGCSESQSCWP